MSAAAIDTRRRLWRRLPLGGFLCNHKALDKGFRGMLLDHPEDEGPAAAGGAA
jgi:hypothetical protein